ncbi:unnamed protein product [Phytophthora lilii]|uniref:Unnamed protein product n=1 Tax=Phytophthora lilii TaxID=2077276 RepID=A0A9W6X1X9_9STRA|nr:unnamed protein product [Phytophthora lilii]
MYYLADKLIEDVCLLSGTSDQQSVKLTTKGPGRSNLPLMKSGSEGPQVPTIWTKIEQGVMKHLVHQETANKVILCGLTGVFKPARITLILGQPGSGKSSLLKILGGRFPLDKTIKFSAVVTYNDIEREKLLSLLARFIAYTNQNDDHYPLLSVHEAFEFAHRCCGGGDLKPTVIEALNKCDNSEKRELAFNIVTAQDKFAADIRVKSLGLDRCKNTKVGNAMIRGVSGGERKRVTTGEMTFGHKRVMH